MDPTSINFLGVLVAAIGAFAVGAVYYIALSKPWMRAARLDPNDTAVRPLVLVTTFLAELVLALMFSLVLGAATFGEYDLTTGVMWGAVFWFGFVLTTVVINQRNQGFGWSLTLIDTIHWLLVFLTIGAVIGWFGPPEMTLT